MSTPITDRVQKVLAEIDAALALADNAHGDSTPDYTHCQGLSEYYEAATDDSGWPLALRCLKTAIEGLSEADEWIAAAQDDALRAEAYGRAERYREASEDCAARLKSILDTWDAGR